jgi:hypothetical protein
VANKIALPPFMSNLHDVFHVSQLRMCMTSHIINGEFLFFLFFPSF